jgi:hypothetical protein
MPYRILLRRDFSINWSHNDPVLMLGEPGVESDTGRLKIGDGQSPWTALPYTEIARKLRVAGSLQILSFNPILQ